MNKTELKNFAINSRLELLSRVRDRAALYGITEEKCKADSIVLAEAFLNELTALFTNRGLRTASNLSDCWRPEMPSVIVECGYHDTVSDANRILNNKDLIAQLYCNALVKYLGLVRKA